MDLKKEEILSNIIFGIELNWTDEDREMIRKLIDSYYRKRTGLSNSKMENVAGGLLWVYSKVNFLWEGDNSWSRASIAEKLGVKSKTIGNKTGEIMKVLKMGCFDDRFARRSVAKRNPFNQFKMRSDGFIVFREGEGDE